MWLWLDDSALQIAGKLSTGGYPPPVLIRMGDCPFLTTEIDIFLLNRIPVFDIVHSVVSQILENIPGLLAEELGSGLQNRVRRCNSGRGLHSRLWRQNLVVSTQ